MSGYSTSFLCCDGSSPPTKCNFRKQSSGPRISTCSQANSLGRSFTRREWKLRRKRLRHTSSSVSELCYIQDSREILAGIYASHADTSRCSAIKEQRSLGLHYHPFQETRPVKQSLACDETTPCVPLVSIRHQKACAAGGFQSRKLHDGICNIISRPATFRPLTHI
jgi:hypothetical protein